jgi:hypothetical protein
VFDEWKDRLNRCIDAKGKYLWNDQFDLDFYSREKSFIGCQDLTHSLYQVTSKNDICSFDENQSLHHPDWMPNHQPMSSTHRHINFCPWTGARYMARSIVSIGKECQFPTKTHDDEMLHFLTRG